MTNTQKPIISVVTCTYNSEKFLPKALKSIESQDYQHIEHIINDSYSTDKTLQIIEDYIQSNKNRYPIRLIQSEPKGVGNALNFASLEATGDLIHYLHSDDYYVNADSLSKVAAYFIKYPELVWLTGNFLVDLHGKLFAIPQTLLLRRKPERALYSMNFISHENTFMKREAVQAYGGFHEKDDEVVEYNLWLNLIKDHPPMVVNDQYTAFIIHKGSRSTGNLIKFSKALSRAFRTQRKVKILPLVGYYEQKKAYIKAKRILKKLEELRSFMNFKNIDFFGTPK